MLAGLLLEIGSPRALMAHMAAVLAALVVSALLRMRLSGSLLVEAQAEFVAMARTSPAVLALDPRARAQSARGADR